jgi:serine/threonine-protein kinase RsbW
MTSYSRPDGPWRSQCRLAPSDGTGILIAAQADNASDLGALTRSYPGQRGQVCLVRATLARLLEDCPSCADAVLIASELAANAVLHTRSAAPGGQFTVRAEARPGDYVLIEVDDQGGSWASHGRQDDRPHGLDLINALVGTGNWGICGNAEHGRTAWARLDWPRPS